MSRDDFYAKELTFQVSASYGPGRYDPNYDSTWTIYRICGWTEQRNLSCLRYEESGALNVRPLRFIILKSLTHSKLRNRSK